MKNTKVMRLLVVSTLCLAQVGAFAGNGNGHGNGHEKGHGKGHGNSHDERGDSRSARSSHDGDRHSHEDHGRHEGERGGGPDHSFYRGERLPTYYRSQHYVVTNWHEHGLRSPPRGYHWVQTGGDYLLVAIATGIIFELLLSR